MSQPCSIQSTIVWKISLKFSQQIPIEQKLTENRKRCFLLIYEIPEMHLFRVDREDEKHNEMSEII